MTVEIEQLGRDTDELKPIGRVSDGDIVDGEDALSSLLVKDNPSDDYLLDRFRGPSLFARRVDEDGGDGSTAEAADAPDPGFPPYCRSCGNNHRIEGRFKCPACADDVDADTFDGGLVEAARDGPFADVPVIPDGTTKLTQDALTLWVAWVRAGRPQTMDEVQAREFNPELHPRDPDTGKFVERPWDLPNDPEVDSIRAMPTVDMLQELKNAGEPIDQVLASSNVSIDGIPDNVNSVEQAKATLGGDGLVFQDLEAGDHVEIVGEGGQLSKGTIQKTEQVDGAPNRAHIYSDHGTLKVVDVPEGASISRDTSPVMPPTSVKGDQPLTTDEISTGQPVTVVTGFDSGNPTHAATGPVDEIGEQSGFTSINVGDSDYAVEHGNVQVYDASPDDVSFQNVSEGDTVAAFTGSGSMKIAEGEVVEKSSVGSNNYVTVKDADSGDEVQVNTNTQNITEPGAVTTDNAVDAAKAAQQQGGDLDLSEVKPWEITPADVPDDRTKAVIPSDLNEGDWIEYGPGSDPVAVGKITGISGTGNQALVKIDKGGTDEGGVKEIELHQQGVLNRITEQDPADDLSFDTDPENIDPSTVSQEAVNSSQVNMAYGFADTQEGDWVLYEGESGVHAGKITQPGPSSIQVETGHYSDPQDIVDDTDNLVGKIDDKAVVDIGDPAGQDSPDTSVADPPESKYDLSDIQTTPGDNITPSTDDLKHPVTAGPDAPVGVIPEDLADAFEEFLRDPDQGETNLLDPAKSGNAGGQSYPQANPQKTKDHITAFGNTVDGLQIDNAVQEFGQLMDFAGVWKGGSYNNESKAIEKWFHAALDLPGDFRNSGLTAEDPTDDEAKVAALATAATQSFIRENFDDFETVDPWGASPADDELPLYRGPGKHGVASLARDYGEDPNADDVTVGESKVTNYTTDPGTASTFGSGGVLLKQNAAVEDMVFSPDVMTGEITGIDNEGEIWLNGGLWNTDPENISVGGSGDLTMADIMGKDPSDLDYKEVVALKRMAEAMNKRDYTLASKQQIATWEDVLERASNSAMSQSEVNEIGQMVSRSKKALVEKENTEVSPTLQTAD